MDSNATYSRIGNANYLKAMNVQNALGYKCSNDRAGWREYETALGKRLRTCHHVDSFGYIGNQVLLAVLGELA